MSLDNWLLYVATVLVFMIAPGPSHLLMLSTSLSNGFHRSLATAGGDLSANALQMLLAGLGLAAILAASQYGVTVVKWAGVAYLAWLGVRQFLASLRTPKDMPRQRPVALRTLFLRGFLTSAANPKAVVFFAALFPQFINPDGALGVQLAILGATYIVIDGCFLLTYGAGADWLSKRLGERRRALVDRFAGGFLVFAAVLLGIRGVAND